MSDLSDSAAWGSWRDRYAPEEPEPVQTPDLLHQRFAPEPPEFHHVPTPAPPAEAEEGFAGAGGAMIGATTGNALLAKHASLFWQARQGDLSDRQFVAVGGRLYSVGDTLRVVERELRKRGNGVILAHEPPCIDLANIVVQRLEWESEEAA